MKKYVTAKSDKEMLAVIEGMLTGRAGMKNQFEVWRFNFPDKGEHPVVLISHPDLCARAVANVLFCTSQRQSRPPRPFEVMLNGADVPFLYAVASIALYGKRGRAIRAMLRDTFRHEATD